MTMTVPIQTRLGDYDPFGHVNNNALLAYCDLGKTAYMQSLPGGFDPAAVGAVVVNINCDFLEPALMGQSLEVQTTVTSLSAHSAHVYQRVADSRTGHVKMQCATVLAGFDIATQQGAPLPAALVQLICSREGLPLPNDTANG